ncbi:helix-turn-helix transcriptional regulator [Limobrevibacterium gyesilva]|uniref:YafY family transcriptional regulator n=1 Tax=Limobrevibacterium gyesilva TaxID=2991712 RepID=A0AA41YWI0_9PROT|nr:YafY family protein [Limobrevibacterium gyesilva]MCW3476652.1 YafY family transcriptional regulator [Limobrevibacterium gyesilva]
MRRADRLFDIIQVLRLARTPITAAAIAAELEVAPRTVYRDIATLQARRVPIEGAAGLGYVLRRGFELPPLMFTDEEAEAIAIGLQLLHRTGDPGLTAAARTVVAKLASVVPEGMRGHLVAAPFHVSHRGAPAPGIVDLSEIRSAIRDARKLRIAYVDANNANTSRTVRPIAVEYYVDATLICAWCELRNDYRHFRIDRIGAVRVLAESFADEAQRLMAGWLALTRPK